jgi:hypothetical protein
MSMSPNCQRECRYEIARREMFVLVLSFQVGRIVSKVERQNTTENRGGNGFASMYIEV